MTAANGSVTAAVAEWAASHPPAEIPGEVREAARWLILDHLACSIGGRQLTPATILLDLFAEQGGAPQATVFATGDRTSVLHATHLNAALSNLLDFDDSFPGAGHPGGTVVPAAIAVAEQSDATLDELIDAVVTGYEVSIRIGVAIRPSQERYRHVAGYSVWQTLGATAAAGRLLGLTAEQFQYALGLGVLNAPVPNMRKLGLEPEERPFSWTKNNYGWAAQGGVLGALLAGRGFLGPKTILDGERGFWIMAGSDRFDPEIATTGFGSEWITVRTGFKPYASCRWTHTALDAVRQHKTTYPDVEIADIGSATVHAFFEVSDNLAQPDPTDIIDAQFSVRHVMALEFLDRSPRYGLSEADLSDPAVVDLRHRIEVQEDPAYTQRYFSDRKMPARLVVRTRDGRELTTEVTELPGSPSRPMTTQELDEKHRALIEPVIGDDGYQGLQELILHSDGSQRVQQPLRRALAGGVRVQ
jgi:2-methylcitrate dehydratase PrpD